jgi:four helix bundle protein
MEPIFDHEKLRAYQEALRFVAWVEPLLETLPAKLSARDNLDRASTSAVLNTAEGNGKRGRADRCRYFDNARGSSLECAACLDVLVAKRKLEAATAIQGKMILVGVVSLLAGLIAHFSEGKTAEDPAGYGNSAVGNEVTAEALRDENEKD